MVSQKRRSTWLRGALELCLMAQLLEGEAYGYQLAGRLEELGLGPVPGGSLYPALLRREQAGHVTSDWRAGAGGPGRKYYALTPAGRAALEEEAAEWRAFAGSVEAALGGVPR